MKGRDFTSDKYRYGFNGKEKDDEVKGSANSIDYGMRFYDTRLGRFLSVDPLSSEFPWNSTYSYAENQVIWAVDLDGAEKSITINKQFYDTYITEHLTAEQIKASYDDDIMGHMMQQIRDYYIINDAALVFTDMGITREETTTRYLLGFIPVQNTTTYAKYKIEINDAYNFLGDKIKVDLDFEYNLTSVTHGGFIDIPLTVLGGYIWSKFFVPVATNVLSKLGNVSGNFLRLATLSKAAAKGETSALAEIKIMKQAILEGKNVEVLSEKVVGKNMLEKTADMIINGVKTDVKRASGIGSGLAKSMAQGAAQVGAGGEVIVVRGIGSKASVEEFQSFINGFIEKNPGLKDIKFTLKDEASLPKAFGK